MFPLWQPEIRGRATPRRMMWVCRIERSKSNSMGLRRISFGSRARSPATSAMIQTLDTDKGAGNEAGTSYFPHRPTHRNCNRDGGRGNRKREQPHGCSRSFRSELRRSHTVQGDAHRAAFGENTRLADRAPHVPACLHPGLGLGIVAYGNCGNHILHTAEHVDTYGDHAQCSCHQSHNDKGWKKRWSRCEIREANPMCAVFAAARLALLIFFSHRAPLFRGRERTTQLESSYEERIVPSTHVKNEDGRMTALALFTVALTSRH